MLKDKNQRKIDELVSHYRKSREERTLILHKKNLTYFFRFCNKEYYDVERKDIKSYRLAMKNSGLSPRTIKDRLNSLRLFYEYLYKQGKTSKNPTENIENPKIDETLPYYLSFDKLNKLREMAKDNKRDSAVVETLYTTGVRLSELVRIKKKDINWKSKFIFIRDGKGKKERFVKFNTECYYRLKGYLRDRNPKSVYLFTPYNGKKPISKKTIQDMFHNYSDRLGFQVNARTLRHTFAAHLAIQGMPLECIQLLLGHDKRENTKVYTKLYHEARKEVYDKYII
ncbi:tyrosine-type recombinase/integrase [Natranaerobius trueperi]|uniref:tyrosine-type recombinase/integrase n=1 Tax=Natranaerobius trueperi TaxID=759412 RepID=UPI0013035399|nr:tyrosine-type recombinase/integrase [Natranaerobius trueperi]